MSLNCKDVKKRWSEAAHLDTAGVSLAVAESAEFQRFHKAGNLKQMLP
jgi:hypothetical protein